MKNATPTLFLSYCHSDNKENQITRLKEEILNTVNRNTALHVDIFQDNVSIEYGKDFNKEIFQNQLDQTSFFIPILTPSYFKSKMCVKELRYFLKQAHKDSNKRIMPVYFTRIKPEVLDLFSIPIQTLYKEVMKIQYLDCTNLRKENFRSLKNSDKFLRYTEELSGQLVHIYKMNLQQNSKAIGTSTPKNSKSVSQKKEREQEMARMWESIKIHLKRKDKPRILICGKVGNGKTSTINTLFGKKVGKTSSYEQGTVQDHQFTWKYEDNEIVLIDLPGLGVGKEEDQEYEKIYHKYMDEHKNGTPIHAILLIVTPPRLAEGGAIDTLRLLLQTGYPAESIIFGLNKIQLFDYDTARGTKNVALTKGNILRPCHKKIVEMGKSVFLENIHKKFPNYHFESFQCIAYDAKTGWNIFKLLHALVNVMPYTTLTNLMKATQKATNDLIAHQKDLRVRAEYEKEKKNLNSAVARKLIDGIGVAIDFVSPKLGAQFEKKKPILNKKVADVIESGKMFKNSLRDLLKW